MLAAGEISQQCRDPKLRSPIVASIPPARPVRPDACEVCTCRARLAWHRGVLSHGGYLETDRISSACLLRSSQRHVAQDVRTDHDRKANFAQYKTFMWIKEPKTTDPLMRQRVIEDVNAALAGRGLQLVTSNADLCIAAHAATKEERSLATFYSGFGGGWRWGGGFGSATTTVNTYEIGTLVVDIFDARSKEAIWRGTSPRRSR